jgi:hypothetical protein
MLFLVIVAVAAAIDIFRRRHAPGGYIGYHGGPRWAVRLFDSGEDSK